MEQCEKCMNCSSCGLKDSHSNMIECANFYPLNNMELRLCTDKEYKVYGGLFGAAIGDALGVPVEFMNRERVRKNPVKEMRGDGTHGVPIGTWSDDTSMTLCLVDALTQNVFDLQKLSNNFIDWYTKDYVFKSTERYFDIGGTTCDALHNMMIGDKPLIDCGSKGEKSNGNGSLMRILPIVYANVDMNLLERIKLIEDVSSLTHGHLYSRFSCVFYVIFCSYLYKYKADKLELFRKAKEFAYMIRPYYTKKEDWEEIEEEFRFILREDLPGSIVHEDDSYCTDVFISGKGYCLSTLKAAIWCLLTTNNYKDCVLKAVNLGYDTDTTACVAGGLAGTYYGFNAIPNKWVQLLERNDYLLSLYTKFVDKQGTHKALLDEYI